MTLARHLLNSSAMGRVLVPDNAVRRSDEIVLTRPLFPGNGLPDHIARQAERETLHRGRSARRYVAPLTIRDSE